MKTLRVAAILPLFLVIQLFIACTNSSSTTSNSGSSANNAADNSNSARSNVEELGVLINMPYEAEDVVWKDYQEQKKVVAVLRFSTADANKLVAQAEKVRKPNPVTVGSESWFPPELVAQSDVSGDNSIKGVSYAADEFLQAPYNDGQITRIKDTDYFVLEVSAK